MSIASSAAQDETGKKSLVFAAQARVSSRSGVLANKNRNSCLGQLTKFVVCAVITLRVGELAWRPLDVFAKRALLWRTRAKAIEAM